MDKISDSRLEMFINKTHGWKNLPPQDVMLMALELKQYREADKNNRGKNGN